jgi:DNA-binding MarR family transcriptional regulator
MPRRSRTGIRGRPTAGEHHGEGSIAFLLAQVGAHAAARFAERLTPLGLAPQHAGILRLIGSSAGLSQRVLGERLGILPSRLVALVDDLEGRALVERRDDPEDRRSYALHLSEAGRATLGEVRRVAREHGESLCAALNDEERRQLAAMLTRIADEQGLVAGVHPGYKRL